MHESQTLHKGPSTSLLLGFVGLLGVTLFLVSITGLPDFDDNEYRLAAFIIDVIRNGNWICPHDAYGALIPSRRCSLGSPRS